MIELILNHTYLLRYKFEENLLSVTILVITDKAYHLRWNNGMETSQTWQIKENFINTYVVIEDISDYMNEKWNIEELHKDYDKKFEDKVPQVKTEWIQCYICKGFGTVPDPNSTTMNKPCPLCQGSKVLPKITEIH